MMSPECELVHLRRRVKAQRAELRRLNQIVGRYWVGVRTGLNLDFATRLRGTMVATFGREAVLAAERAPCNCRQGPGWCAVHGNHG